MLIIWHFQILSCLVEREILFIPSGGGSLGKSVRIFSYSMDVGSRATC